MSQFGPIVVSGFPLDPASVPAAPVGCPRREIARWQWRVGDPGEPARLLEDFLTAHGLPVRSLHQLTADPLTHRDAGLCGAAVFVSAAAGAVLAGGPVGAPSPAPAVPDVVAIVFDHGGRPAAPRLGPAAAGGCRFGAWRDSWSPQRHATAVEQVRAAIGCGDVYQVNLVGHAATPYRGDPVAALARLGRLPGARYGGVLCGPGWALGCASPETLIEVRGGRLVTRPIKGTRPATADGHRQLLASAKERAEHVMIVDLERNDLARVAATGSVRVDELYAIRRWCDLWQAESVVSATAADGLGLADLLHAVCPGGSVTGAPKLAALGHIAALEPVGRGASMGALGWIGPDGIDLGLTIRTAAADRRLLHVWAGGGITWGSDPWAEVAEAAAKAAPLRAALAGAGRRATSVGPGTRATR